MRTRSFLTVREDTALPEHQPISEMTLKDASHRSAAIMSVLWAGASQLTTALVIKVAQITKLSLMQARLIVGAAAGLVVLVFVGLLSVSAAAASSPEATARGFIQASMNGDGTKLLDMTCTVSQPYLQSLIGSGMASLSGDLRGLNLNDITYTTTTRTDTRAIVHVAGGRSTNVNASLQLNVPELYERGQWRLCYQ
jgi:hypothetical protein